MSEPQSKPSLTWLWRWESMDGITHFTTDIDEADLALHTPGTVMVLAERIKDKEVYIHD